MVNLPNFLTVLRALMIPLFAWLYYADRRPIAFVVYLAACLTDFLDGYLARKWNQITAFGKLMDPLADKLMTLTMLYCLADTGYIPMWAVILLLAKEILMVLGGAFLLGGRKVVVMANWSGKAATALMILAVAMVFPWHPWAGLRAVGYWVFYLALAVALYAMINYATLYLGRGNNVKKASGGKED